MKTSRIKKPLQRLAATTVAVLLGSFTLNATADSPVGDWDLYFSGGQKGVALLTFNPDFTIEGVEMHHSGTLPKAPEVNPRGGNTIPDNPRSPNNGDSGPNTFHCGANDIVGFWGYGLKGKIVGSMLLYNADSTNGWSFTGVAKGVSGNNPKLTLSVTRSDSGLKSVMHGVLRAPLPDVSGVYTTAGTMRNRINGYSQGFSQFLEVTSPSSDYTYPNAYNVFEVGPGYAGGGFAILTRNKHFGIYSAHVNPADGATNIIVLSGKFNTNTLRGNLTGYDGDKFSIKATMVNTPTGP